MICGSHAAAEHHRQERGPARHDVVRPGERPHEIQVDHAFAPVAAQQLRRDDRREHEQDDRRDAVVVGVRRQVQPLRGARAAESSAAPATIAMTSADRRQHGDEEPRKDLGAPAAAESERDAQSVLEDRAPRRPRPSRRPV